MRQGTRHPRHCKAVNFDLITQNLRKKFGESGRSRAYRSIGSYLAEKGFEHRQGSGYRSASPLSDLEAVYLISCLYQDLDWLYECVRRLDVTNIGREYDMDSIVRRQACPAPSF